MYLKIHKKELRASALVGLNWENNRNARHNNNQLITYYLHVCYLLGIQKYPVNTTYNTSPPSLHDII